MKTGLIFQPDRWAPSYHPYAILRNSATQKKVGPRASSWRVDAVWAGIKHGVHVVTVGQLSLWNSIVESNSLDAAITNADMRYGGDWFANWDGTRFSINTEHNISLLDYTHYVPILDRIRTNLPEVPESYEGWYYRRSTLR